MIRLFLWTQFTISNFSRPIQVSRIGLSKSLTTLKLDGSMQLSRDDSINQQIPKGSARVQKQIRKDTLGLDGEMDLAR